MAYPRHSTPGNEVMNMILVPILLYHSIAERVAKGYKIWALSPEMFDMHIRHLRNRGYTPLTISQLVARMDEPDEFMPKNPVVITFDDGLDDFYENALPVLKRYKFRATLFITTGYVGRTSKWLAGEGEGGRPMLNWEKVREIDNCGIECGSHSLTHPQLDVIRNENARREISQSKQILENHLGKPVESFAYPHGYHSADIKQMVVQAGYSSACAVMHAMSCTGDDRFALARINICSDTDVQTLDNLLNGKGLQLAPLEERITTKAWRFYRRVTLMFQERAALNSPARELQ